MRPARYLSNIQLSNSRVPYRFLNFKLLPVFLRAQNDFLRSIFYQANSTVASETTVAKRTRFDYNTKN